jgi:hypothetical protein
LTGRHINAEHPIAEVPAMQLRPTLPRAAQLSLLLLIAAGPCAAQTETGFSPDGPFWVDPVRTPDDGCDVKSLPNTPPILSKTENRPEWLTDEVADSIAQAYTLLKDDAVQNCKGPIPMPPPPDPSCEPCTFSEVKTSEPSPPCRDTQPFDAKCRPKALPDELKECFRAWAAASASYGPENFNIVKPSRPGQVDDNSFPNTGSAVGYPSPPAGDAVMCGTELGYTLSLVVEEVVYQFGNAGLADMVALSIQRFGQRSKDLVRDSVRDGARRRYLARDDALDEFAPGGPWRALVLEPIDMTQVDFGEFIAGVRDLQPNDDPGGSASAP